MKNKTTLQTDGVVTVKVKGNYKDNWTDERVTSRTIKKDPVDFSVGMTLDQSFYETAKPVRADYTAADGKSGKFTRSKVQP